MGAENRETEALLACSDTREQQELLGKFFEEHFDRLRAAVKLRLSGPLAKRVSTSDVLQDTYIEAAKRLSDYLKRPTLPFFLWLRYLALQRLKTLYRRHVGTKMRDLRREVPIDEASDPTPSAHAAFSPAKVESPSQIFQRIEREDRFQASLDRLEPLDREVVLLRHFEKLSWADSSKVLGLEEATLRQRHTRALKKFKEALRQSARDRSRFWR